MKGKSDYKINTLLEDGKRKMTSVGPSNLTKHKEKNVLLDTMGGIANSNSVRL